MYFLAAYKLKLKETPALTGLPRWTNELPTDLK